MTDDPAEVANEASRRLSWLPKVLVVLATVLLIVSTMTTWVKSQALDTDQWIRASNQMLEQPEVADALSVYLANELFDAVDMEQVLETRLPDNLSGLAGPIAGTLRGTTTDAIDRIISSARFRAVWDEANTVAHGHIVAVLRGESRGPLAMSDGTVVLDLGEALRTVGSQLGVPEAALDRIPADAGQITLFHSGELASAQHVVKVIDFTSWFTFLVVVMMYVLAVYLAVDSRRLMVRTVGVSLLVGSLVLLAIRAVGIRTSVSLFVQNPSNEHLARLAGVILTELLREIAWTGIVYGVLIVAFAELLGNHRWAIATRSYIAEKTDSVMSLVVTGVVLTTVLLWWSPGRAFDRWVTAVTLVALVAGAVVSLVVTGRRDLASVASDSELPASESATD